MTSIVEPCQITFFVGSAWALLALFSLNIDLTNTTHYFLCILQYLEVKRILLPLTIACLCHKGIHIPSFYGNVLRKILPNKRRCSRRAHIESAVNTPLVTEQMTESVHTTSLWPSWNGKSGKPLFIYKLAHTCIQMCLEKHLFFINSYTHIQVYIHWLRLTQIICSALCHTHAVLNLPTADVSADLILT